MGIDLGTTSSVIAVVKDGKPAVLPDSQGRISLPSVVAFPEEGKEISLVSYCLPLLMHSSLTSVYGLPFPQLGCFPCSSTHLCIDNFCDPFLTL